MARKQHKPAHVKTVKRGDREYLYFNTGQKRNGKPIYARLPPMSSASFWPTYASLDAGRNRRAEPSYTVGKLVDEYLAGARFAKLAENTRKNYAVQALKIKEVWGEYSANDLRPSDVRLVLESGKWGAGTCNMVLAVIGTVYKWGRRNKGLTINPTRDVDRQEVNPHEP